MNQTPNDPTELQPTRSALRLVFTYAVFASLWIGLSDQLVAWLTQDPERITRLSLLTGWLFVVATSLLLFALIRRQFQRLCNASAQEKAAQIRTQFVEAAQRKSEIQYRALFENSLDAILLTQPDGRIVSANPQACRLFGYTETQLRQLGRDGVVDLSDPRLPAALAERQKSGHFSGELTFFDSHQRKFSGEVLSQVFDGDEGQIMTCMVVRDITERKAQLHQIQLSAQVFAQAREGITITDASGNIVMINQAFTNITGYSREEILGRNPRLLQSGQQSASFYAAMWSALATEGHWSGEIWNKKKDGTIYPEWLVISALRDTENRTTHYVANFSDLSQTKADESRIQWLSHFDPLTGLANRALLQDRAAMAVSMVERAGEPLALMLVAIDHFGNINETLGHQTGDQLLVEMARRLSHCVREQDTVARLGGKEFILVLPGTAAAGAAHLASELLRVLAEPCQLNDQRLSVTASLGIASYPDNGADFDSLFNAVEVAMRRAQSMGRNTYQFYSTEQYEQLLARDAMTKALSKAIEQNQLRLVYQPQVDLQTGNICGMEALLRWTHPELGDISPVQFIPLAEESGLIVDIGNWVLHQSCRDIRYWLDKGIDVPHVAVNASPMQFRKNNLVRQVANALNASQIDPARIYIEVTESALLDDVPHTETMLKELKKSGVKLSLDDFGTGYSSLSYLKRFPFDQVKIDQSFVRDITTSQSDHMLVGVIVSMAHGLGMKAIAEGVETEAQCEVVRISACDEIQGYVFSKPVSALGIEQLFAQNRQLAAHLLRQKKPQRTLLLVDDEPHIVSALKRLFRSDGFLILTANGGAEGLEVLSKHKVDVIISDQRMPGMTGVEFLRQAKDHYPDTIRIVLSGYTELQSITDAINQGAAYRFFTKPWDDELLRAQIHKAIAYKAVLEENQQLDIQIRSSNRELVAANRQLAEALQQLRLQMTNDPSSLAIEHEGMAT
jgi:diguanylate cyclase (GGDEF)-like protein/PAS domain S-box-containing protein